MHPYSSLPTVMVVLSVKYFSTNWRRMQVFPTDPSPIKIILPAKPWDISSFRNNFLLTLIIFYLVYSKEVLVLFLCLIRRIHMRGE